MWIGQNDAPLNTKFERMERLQQITSTIKPKVVGYIVVADGVKWPVYAKPSLFHMLMMNVFFGWDYEPKELK